MRSLAVSSDGRWLWTCGDDGVMMWTLPGVFDGSHRSEADEAGRPWSTEGARQGAAGASLEGRSAVIPEELKGEVFVDVACSEAWRAGDGGQDGGVGAFCVTSRGALCAFSRCPLARAL